VADQTGDVAEDPDPLRTERVEFVQSAEGVEEFGPAHDFGDAFFPRFALGRGGVVDAPVDSV